MAAPTRPACASSSPPSAWFSLDEVAQLLRLNDGAQCSQASEIAARHLRQVQAKLAELERIAAVLSKVLRRCKTNKGQLRCPLISSLHDADSL